jgi:SAM-dependent methyltransferase
VDNSKFIDGSWYEEQYSPGGMYYGIYKEHPEWAKQTDAFFVRIIYAVTGISKDTTVLDLGSGVGQYIQAWRNEGFNAHGIEISQTAIDQSPVRHFITQGSISDMPFKDDEFDLVFSASVFEHIDESIVDKAILEASRVGNMQVHMIGREIGHDPSHINIKTMNEWYEKFKTLLPDNEIILVPEILMCEWPILIVMPKFTYHPLNIYKILFEDAYIQGRLLNENVIAGANKKRNDK